MLVNNYYNRTTALTHYCNISTKLNCCCCTLLLLVVSGSLLQESVSVDEQVTSCIPFTPRLLCYNMFS